MGKPAKVVNIVLCEGKTVEGLLQIVKHTQYRLVSQSEASHLGLDVASLCFIEYLKSKMVWNICFCYRAETALT